MNREALTADTMGAFQRAATNPFAQQRLERLLFRFPDNRAWDAHLNALHRVGYRAAIVGPRGSGKSTLLREMHRRLSTSCETKSETDDGGFARDAISEPLTATLPLSSVHGLQTLLIDIPPRRFLHEDFGLSDCQRRQWLQARFARVTPQTILLIDGIERLPWSQRFRLLHSTARQGRCGGLVVTLHRPCRWTRLPVWVHTRPTLELLEIILKELGITGSLPPDFARQLFEKHAGNLREVLREMFDRSSSRVQTASQPRSGNSS